MLVIRDAQVQSFIANNDDDLLTIVCDAVSKADRDRVSGISPDRLRSMAKLGIERARAEGFNKAEDIAAFVALMFEISPSFYTQPAIAAVLADANYSPGERLIQLPERIPEEAWAEAESGYDAGLWFSEGEQLSK
jgi:hypothetical protein